MLNNIGKKIRKYREEAGMSQKKLGMILGLSDKAISAYESCRTLPPIETLYRIANELEKPLSLFISEETKENGVKEKVYEVETKVEHLLKDLDEVKKLLNRKK